MDDYKNDDVVNCIIGMQCRETEYEVELSSVELIVKKLDNLRNFFNYEINDKNTKDIIKSFDMLIYELNQCNFQEMHQDIYDFINFAFEILENDQFNIFQIYWFVIILKLSKLFNIKLENYSFLMFGFNYIFSNKQKAAYTVIMINSLIEYFDYIPQHIKYSELINIDECDLTGCDNDYIDLLVQFLLHIFKCQSFQGKIDRKHYQFIFSLIKSIEKVYNYQASKYFLELIYLILKCEQVDFDVKSEEISILKSICTIYFQIDKNQQNNGLISKILKIIIQYFTSNQEIATFLVDHITVDKMMYEFRNIFCNDNIRINIINTLTLYYRFNEITLLSNQNDLWLFIKDIYSYHHIQYYFRHILEFILEIISHWGLLPKLCANIIKDYDIVDHFSKLLSFENSNFDAIFNAYKTIIYNNENESDGILAFLKDELESDVFDDLMEWLNK